MVKVTARKRFRSRRPTSKYLTLWRVGSRWSSGRSGSDLFPSTGISNFSLRVSLPQLLVKRRFRLLGRCGKGPPIQQFQPAPR